MVTIVASIITTIALLFMTYASVQSNRSERLFEERSLRHLRVQVKILNDIAVELERRNRGA